MVSSERGTRCSNDTEETAMTLPRRSHTRQQQARQRRLQRERERLQREQARAQRARRALEEAMAALGLPETVAEDGQWRRHTQQHLRGKICGRMFPPGVWL